VSESAFNARDWSSPTSTRILAYRALAQTRLSEDVVVAPYADSAAAMIDRKQRQLNFVRLTEVGASGRYGFYEAFDYTATRFPRTKTWPSCAPIWRITRGCDVALAICSLRGRHARAFHAEPRMQATELLLRGTHAEGRPGRSVPPGSRRFGWSPTSAISFRRFCVDFDSPHDIDSRHPSSLQWAIRGDGHHRRLRIQPLAQTLRLPDGARTARAMLGGVNVFLRDAPQRARSGQHAYQPSGVEPDSYEVAFSEDHVEIRRRDGALRPTL